MLTLKSKASMASGPWAIAHWSPIQRRANIVRPRRNMLRAKAKLLRKTLSRPFTADRKWLSVLKRLARLLRLVAAQVSRVFSVWTFLDSWLGFSGGESTGVNCRAWKRKHVWRSIGHWMFFSQKTLSNFSINARWPHHKLKPGRRRGIATNFLNQLKTMIASLHEEPVEVPSTSAKWMTGTSVRMDGDDIKPSKEIPK